MDAEKDTGTSGSEGDTTRSMRRMNVADLLAGDRELILMHGQAEYRLRLTNNDKLILTK